MTLLDSLSNAILAHSPELPPVVAAYEYVVAANGLYIRSQDSRIEAMVPARKWKNPLPGLAEVQPYARLRVPRIPAHWLWSVIARSVKALPNEAMFQFTRTDGQWACTFPPQKATPARVTFDDMPDSIVDLHSHGIMKPFFSETDNRDEKGFRFYVVIGQLDKHTPFAVARVGVYGNFMDVPLSLIFDDYGHGLPIEDWYSND